MSTARAQRDQRETDKTPSDHKRLAIDRDRIPFSTDLGKMRHCDADHADFSSLDAAHQMERFLSTSTQHWIHPSRSASSSIPEMASEIEMRWRHRKATLLSVCSDIKSSSGVTWLSLPVVCQTKKSRARGGW